MTHRKKLAAVGGAVALAAVAVAVAIASPATDLTGVPSANTKSPATRRPRCSRRSSRRSRSPRARRRSRTRRRRSRYYGYDNDVLNAAGAAADGRRRRDRRPEAHKTEPDKNTYLVFEHEPDGADPSYDYGTHFLFQGHEAASPGYITRINLDADAAHRVTLLATQDSNGNADRRRSTARRGTRWPSGCCSRPRTRARRRTAATPGYPSHGRPTSPARSAAAATRASRTTATATSGSSRTSAAPNKPGTTAKIPNSFVYRYVPEAPGDLANGKLQVLQVLNARRHADHQGVADAAQCRPTRSRCTPTAVVRHAVGDDPRHRRRRQRSVQREHAREGARTARRSSGPRTGCSARTGTSSEFYFDETGDTNADQPRERLLRRLDRRLQADAGRPVRDDRQAHALLQGRHGPRRLRQRRVPLEGPDHVRRGRGRRAARVSATRSTRASSST